MSIQLLGLYAGGISQLQPDGRPSGIIKQRLSSTACIQPGGIEGDVQADRRVHGGPEKALHQFASEHFANLADTFPAAADRLQPGSIGENLSTLGITEADACIGDIFRLGTALLQISQPRRPCWKIDRRYDQDGLAQHIELAGTTGWYYRVLETGHCQADDALCLQEQTHPGWTIFRINDLEQALRPDIEELQAAAQLAALNRDWRQRWCNRVDGGIA
ncbi:MAG: MOSC domain-containing protein [Nevskiales bacterium]